MQNKDICKAFCNEDRLNLLNCLSTPRTVTELLGKCRLSQSALSQHLRVLKDAGLLKSKKEGKFIYYQISGKKALDIAKLIINFK